MRLLHRVASSLWQRERSALLDGLQPVYEVKGTLRVGEGSTVAVGPIRTQIAVTHDGVCDIGDNVFLGHGSSISCDRSVRIGDRTRLGAFAVIYDSDFHTAGSHDLRDGEEHAAPPKTGPVDIGSDVMIGECVTILRGTTIGDGAVVDPGSVLWGSIPAGSRVSGRPQPSSKPTA